METLMTAKAPRPEQIRAARARRGLTQTHAAAVIGWTLRGWQEIEGGRRAMHPRDWHVWQYWVDARAAPPLYPGENR